MLFGQGPYSCLAEAPGSSLTQLTLLEARAPIQSLGAGRPSCCSSDFLLVLSIKKEWRGADLVGENVRGSKEGQVGGGGPNRLESGSWPRRALCWRRETCGGLLLEQPLLTLSLGAPLPFPTFRVVEETQGGGGDEGVHGLLQDHRPSLSPLFPWLQDASSRGPLPPTHAFSVPLPRLHTGHRLRLIRSLCLSLPFLTSVAPSAPPKLPEA